MTQPTTAKSPPGCSRGAALILALLVAVGMFVVFQFWAGSRNSPEDEATEPSAASTSTTSTSIEPLPAEEVHAPEKIEKGQFLYRGSSDDEIGCIPCDGLFRFLSVDDTTVTKGPPGGPQEMAALSAPVPSDGTVSQFGFKLSLADGGNWTANVRRNGQDYILGCSVKIGATYCLGKPPFPEDFHVTKGDRFAISIGNPGKPVTQGAFTVEWWFVYEPDA
jgi:hypothetical protein